MPNRTFKDSEPLSYSRYITCHHGTMTEVPEK